jgi:hypothetical protein
VKRFALGVAVGVVATIATEALAILAIIGSDAIALESDPEY